MIALNDMIVGANAERSRNHNRRLALGHVRAAGQMGRAEIARASGLSTQAVSNIISDLLEDGLIQERGRRVAGRGHPPVQYALNPKGGFAVGIEVRPDAVFATLLDLGGETIVAERRALSGQNRVAITSDVTTLCAEIITETRTPRDRILGVGIVMPGPFGGTGISGKGSDLPIWDSVQPAQWFSEALDLPVLIENDANAAAIAERVSGVAQMLDTYAFIYFGSGLGLGLVQNGQIMTGAFGNAGEIGHIPVPSGGQVVVLESVVSRLSVQSALASEGIDASSVEELDRLFSQQCPPLTAWLNQVIEPLSAAITIIENLFDPQSIILGGAMPDAIVDHMLHRVQLTENSVSNRPDRSQPRLLRGSSGRRTATLGAAALVINQVFTPRIAVQA